MRRICPYCNKIVDGATHQCTEKPKDNRRGRVLSENSTKWRKIRNEVKERDLCCRLCWKNGVYSPIEECHHIIPKEVNEDLIWDTNNVIGLCHDCHKNKVHKTKDSWKEYVELLTKCKG